ncbi:MAG: FkbM family methyltransferase [Sulfuricaulis sp.]
MNHLSVIKRSTLNFRARLTRAIANILIHHSVPGCSRLLRNAYKLFGSLPAGPLRIETRYGFDMIVDPRRNKGVDASIYYNGTYEAGTLYAITNSLRAGDIFIDAGANIGLMSLAAAQVVGSHGKVHAFEPVPDVYAQLRQNVEINKADNILLHNLALGSKHERRTIYEQALINKGSASFVEPILSSSAKHMVDVDTLDRFSNANGINTIRMIKADVEGWELEVLQGAKSLLSASNAPILCIEYSVSYSPRRDQLLDVYDFIRNVNGYRFFKLKNGKETISPLVKISSAADLPKHDNIFCFLPHQIAEIGSTLFK